MSIETSSIICKDCGEPKTRILAGKRGKDKIWVDETASEWNGKLCPKCHVKRVATRKRNKTRLEKAIQEALIDDNEQNS